MPSKSTSFTDDHYYYLTETQEEDQTFASRVEEVLEKGIEAEKAEDEHACSGCGKTFGNEGAKVTHERTCPELQE